MTNLWRTKARSIANSKKAVTISLLSSVSLLLGLASPPALAATDPVPDPEPTVSTFDKTKYSLDDPKSIWVVVDKKRPLNPKKFVPKLIRPPFAHPKTYNPYGLWLAPPAANAIVSLAQAAKNAGAGQLIMQSAYRSFDYQVSIHTRDVKRYGLKAGEALAARPGYSEHQTGLAIDIAAYGQGCTIRVCFAKTRMGRFVAKYGWEYGFIVRYPDGETPTTGYQFEPWHLRFVGLELAKEMHNQGVTVLENFFELPAAPNY